MAAHALGGAALDATLSDDDDGGAAPPQALAAPANARGRVGRARGGGAGPGGESAAAGSSNDLAVKNKHGLRGVRFDKNKSTRPWEVKISIACKDKSLGYFQTKEEAGLQYDLATLRYRGCVARAACSGRLLAARGWGWGAGAAVGRQGG